MEKGDLLGGYFPLKFLHKSVQTKWLAEAQHLYAWVGSRVSSQGISGEAI